MSNDHGVERRTGMRSLLREEASKTQQALSRTINILGTNFNDVLGIGEKGVSGPFDHVRYRDTIFHNYGPVERYAVQAAASQYVRPYLNEGSGIVDWGFGEGLNYPFGSFPENLHYYIIEPEAEAVTRAVEARRIRASDIRQRITARTPPYDQIPKGSIDAVMGISSFHVLPATQMKEVIADLSTKLKPKKPMCHVQQAAITSRFLRGIDPATLEDIGAHIKQVHPGMSCDADGEGESLSMFDTYAISELKALMGRIQIHGISFNSNNSAYQNSPLPNVLKILQEKGIADTARLMDVVNPTQLESRGLVAKMQFTMLTLARLLETVEPSQYDDTILYTIDDFIRTVDSFALHVFEGFLHHAYTKAGLYPKSDHVTTLQKVDGNEPDTKSGVLSVKTHGSTVIFPIHNMKGQEVRYAEVGVTTGIKMP